MDQIANSQELLSPEHQQTLALLQVRLHDAQKQLIECETRLKLISQAINSVVIDWDLENNQFHRFNSPEQLTGYTVQETAHSFEELRSGVHPDDLPRFDQAVHEWLNGQEFELQLVIRYQHKDGNYRDLRGQAIVLREQQTNRPLRIVASYTDITAERQALRSLQLSEERYRLATDAISGIVFDWNTATNTVYRSSGVTRMMGYTPESIDPTPQWWQSLIHPIDRDMVISSITTFMETAESRGSLNYRIRHRQGHYLTIHANYMAIRRSDGRAERIVGCIVDLTPRIQAEQAKLTAERNFHQLFHDIPLGLIVLNPQHEILECNEAFTRLVNLPVQEVIGKSFEHFANLQQWKAAAQLEDSNEFVRELQLSKSDGTQLTIAFRGKYISFLNYQTRCLFGIVEDLTERRHADEEKRRLEKHLQETQKLESLGVLAGGIAHDFNNLLTIILGNLSLIRQDYPAGHTHRHALDHAELASTQAAELCRQLLAYAGRGKLENRPFHLTELVEHSKVLLSSAAGKSHALHFHLSSGLPCMAGDPSQIRQVLLNLVQNAAEAFDNTGGTIDILTGVGLLTDSTFTSCLFHDQQRPGEYLWLEVRDNGQGMDAATSLRIFEPFYTTKFTGRGLGLAAVAGIVRNHKGLIHFSTVPGKGTSFRVYFPIDQTGLPAAVPPPRVEHQVLTTRQQGTVLVADDEPAVRTVLAKLLAKRGFAVIEAENGNEALEMAARHNASLQWIILDLTMPHRDGMSTLQELRRSGQNAPVIIISGYYSSEIVPQLDKLNARFISKPFSANSLLSMIDAGSPVQ